MGFFDWLFKKKADSSKVEDSPKEEVKDTNSTPPRR